MTTVRRAILSTLLAATGTLAVQALDFSSLASVPVQEGGRKKPFLVFADETMTGLSGLTSVAVEGANRSSVEAVARIWLDPEGWEKQPLILINSGDLKKSAGLDAGRKRFSYAELTANEALRSMIREAASPLGNGPKEKSDPLQKAAMEAGQRLAAFEGLVSGRALAIVPSGAAAWTPPKADDPALVKLRAAICSGDQAGFDAAVRELVAEQAKAPVGFQADAWKLAVEAFYQRLHPFRWAWVLYLAAGICLLALSGGASRVGYAAAWALAIGGFLLQAVGFACRTIVSGRAPVTNMYESVVWVAFGTILFALVFEAIYRCRYFLLGAVPVAAVSLIIADTQPVILDRSIKPLVPVLADNFWLTTHVLTITLSYAAFALALGLGHIVLGKVIAGRRPSPALFNYLYRALQVGVLLLATGTILGGVWANYSWGRFWGWDPKETWALIALLGYLFLLHGRIAGKWGGFGLAVGSVLAFLSVLMAWYGVNFVLGVGLHSYGFGAGGFPVALAFVFAELAFVGLALARKNAPGRQEAVAAGSQAD